MGQIFGILVSLMGTSLSAYSFLVINNSQVSLNFIVSISGWIVAIAYCIYSCALFKKSRETKLALKSQLKDNLTEIEFNKKTITRLENVIDYQHQRIEEIPNPIPKKVSN